jgi:peptidoglycan/LPS O-acetylase OafA/YrhL
VKAPSARLHYLDWLLVLAIFGVILFHAVHAFYAVQWEVDLAVKLLVVVVGSLGASLGLYELLVWRFSVVRAFSGLRDHRNAAGRTPP